jgi:diguanylate cyclase (GGDEF)-like protein/PAS domain S-box-containing protein
MGSAEERSGAPSQTTLFTSLAEQSADSIVVVFDDGSIRYMNPMAGAVTGWDPGESRGLSIFELVHPDDVDRAIVDLGVHSEAGAPPGWSTYRVRSADGSWLPMQVTTAEVSDGSSRLLAAFCRAADVSPTEVLFGLLRGTSPVDALTPVLDMFNRKVLGSLVAIAWWDNGGLHHIGTEVPAELAGADGALETPWAVCRREAKPQIADDLSFLDDGRRAAAETLGLGAYWIEPVTVDDSEVHALITVWTRDGAPPPEYHSSGMQTAKDFVELILRWTQQVQLLEVAAHRDALTGLANRKAFFDSLGTGGSGAVLYCDLDRFKPVNDELGHRGGDELLRAVARRIQRCVRSDDIVARLGGDEFAVLCQGATKEQAADLAERIRVAVEEPFQVVGTSAHVGISIGVAHTSTCLGDEVLELADQALYQAKAEGAAWCDAQHPITPLGVIPLRDRSARQ